MPMPQTGGACHGTHKSVPASTDKDIQFPMDGRKQIKMRITRILVATFVALLGLTLLLQQATADSGAGSEPNASTHQVYLPAVSVSSGLTSRSSSSTPNTAISVAAQAVLSCEDTSEPMPVSGARIIVITDHSSRIAMTDASGSVLFSASPEPAVIQIEWPVGLFPCPNSSPSVELPNGIGEVKFMAVAGN